MQKIDSILERLERWCLYLAALAGAAMMLHVVADVFSRTILRNPIYGTNTVAARYYMVALAFLPLAFVTRGMGQMSVDVFTSNMRGWLRRLVELFSTSLMLAYVGMLTWMAYESAQRRTASGEFVDLQIMIIPVWPGRWIVPLACGLLFLHVLTRLYRILTTPDLENLK